MPGNTSTAAIKSHRVGVLLLHGFCGTPTEMSYVANGLTRAGCIVRTPRLAGHGGSEADLAATTWQDWYRSAEEALEELSQECDTVICGGLSTGALISLMLAADHPDDVSAVAMFAPTLWLNGWAVPWYARLFRLCPTKLIARYIRFPAMHARGIKDDRMREFVSRAMASGVQTGLLRYSPGCSVLERRWLVAALKRKLAEVRQPVLIMHSRLDNYASLDNALYLQRRLASPVEVVVLKDSYHAITVDRERDEVVSRTVAFVSRIAARLRTAVAGPQVSYRAG
jgi:carboxylesterase